MKTKMKSDILAFLRKKGAIRPGHLAKELGISPQALYRHLRKLVETGQLVHKGKPPMVFYEIATTNKPPSFSPLATEISDIIEENFSWLSGDGRFTLGLHAFKLWVANIGQVSSYHSLAKAYMCVMVAAQEYLHGGLTIPAISRVASIFEKCWPDNLFYGDFYSLPQFGKTRMGNMVIMGKSGQSLKMIQELAKLTKPMLQAIMKEGRIEALAFAPHSISRKLVFLKEYCLALNLGLPLVKVVKGFTGEIPVAQKSLPKLADRIINAESTLFINETAISFQRILIVDDAVGSGATMNAIARRLKEQFKVEYISGFAIVGSYKGFEVISDV